MIFAALKSYRPGRLAKGTLVMSLGLGLRTLGQAVVFLLIARLLGVDAYGAYSAVLALAMALSWFVGLGASGIMLRDTARDARAFEQAWGRTLAAFLVSAPVVLFLYGLLAWLFFPDAIHWTVVICLGIAEILLSPILQAATHAYQGHERMGRAARMQMVPIVSRVGVTAVLLIGASWLHWFEPLRLWGVLYLLAAIVAAGYALWRLRRDFGLGFMPIWSGLGLSLRDGWPYALASFSGKVYADIDKLMLARLASLEATGVYSAAHRFVDMAGIPLAGLYSASVTRFFRAGDQGIQPAIRYTLRLLPVPLGYAVLAGGVFSLLADFLPWVLGPEYFEAASALRGMAWLPVLSVVRDLLSHVFICTDRQRFYLLVLTLGATANVLLNLWAIPRWGWQGAVGATYVAEFVMIAAQLGLLMRTVRHADNSVRYTSG
nr:polysaccharide biosynthesis protein [uncultured Gammaproteobacteria bacterium]